MIAPEIENAANGRMMVGAWQTYQLTPSVPASVRETGSMVPPLPVRLLNLALNFTAVGRRLDAPLLDGAVIAQPGLATFTAVAAPVAPNAVRPSFPASPAVDADVPVMTAPTLPQTTGDEGGRVPQSPIEPVAAKPARAGQPVAIPAENVVPVEKDDTFDALISDEASDLDILADWPEEEAIDGEVWPDEVPPEAAAEFLMALGNVVAAQSAPAEPNSSADAVDAPVVAPHAAKRTGALPGPLPLRDHMANLQASAFHSGTPVDLPDTPVPAAAGTDEPMVAADRPVAPAPAQTATSVPSRPAAPTGHPAAAQPATPMGIPVAPQQPDSPVSPASAEAAPAAPAAPARVEARRNAAAARRAAEPTRVRADAADQDLPIGLIPKEMVQLPAADQLAPEPAARASVAAPEAQSGHADSGHDQGDAPPEQRQTPEAPVASEAAAQTGFVNPMAFTAQPVMTSEGGDAEDSLVVEAGARTTAKAAPAAESDTLGPITVRTAEAAVAKAPEAAPRQAEPTPVVTTAGMSAQQLIDAVNDGVPMHFAQFPALMEGIVGSKPFVEKTVDIVLQPENLGRIRLEVSLVDGGSAIRVAIATQSVAAQQVFESYGTRLQQIAQSQGYALKEFDVKVSDRPIRSEGRGQAGNDATGQRQNRRRRRGGRDDSTI
jgi:flagellar hook-length control protein FliK